MYDPTSGLYIQTFPPEHHEFLEKYGQRIEMPEHPEPQYVGWAYENDARAGAHKRLQSPGFHYNPGHSSYPVGSEAPSMSSPASDYEAASMLQYIASPPMTAAQTGEQGIPRSAAWSGDYSARLDVVPEVSNFLYYDKFITDQRVFSRTTNRKLCTNQ